MEITIWSDFVCPFCYIAEEHLNQALSTFSEKDDVTIEYKSFQLDPVGTYQPELNYYETFAKLKGMPMDKVTQMMDSVKNMATEAGLTMNYDDAKYSNTLKAHRVFQYAKEEGRGNDYFHRFYRALNLADVQAILNDSQTNHQKVQDDIATAGSIGVQGVPFFVFNNKYAVSGAQPIEIFKNVLEQVAAES